MRHVVGEREVRGGFAPEWISGHIPDPFGVVEHEREFGRVVDAEKDIGERAIGQGVETVRVDRKPSVCPDLGGTTSVGDEERVACFATVIRRIS